MMLREVSVSFLAHNKYLYLLVQGAGSMLFSLVLNTPQLKPGVFHLVSEIKPMLYSAASSKVLYECIKYFLNHWKQNYKITCLGPPVYLPTLMYNGQSCANIYLMVVERQRNKIVTLAI